MPTIDYSQPPTPEQVRDLLTGADWWPEDATQQAQALVQCEIAINAMVQAFVILTGWRQFVSDGVSKTFTYDQADYNGFVDLETGLLTYGSVIWQGQTFTLNTNVYMQRGYLPYGAPDAARRLIQFYPQRLVEPYIRPGQLSVTGIFGVFTQWPPDVWHALLKAAGEAVLTAVNTKQDRASISEGPFSEGLDVVGVIDQKTAQRLWPGYFQDAVMRYRRE